MPALNDAARTRYADIVGRREFFDLTPQTQRQVIRQVTPGFAQLTPQGQDAAFQAIVTDPGLRARAFGGLTAPPSPAEKALREVPAVAGGIGGALAGAALTGGSPVGAAIGGGLLGAGAEAATQKAAGEPLQPARIAQRGIEAVGGEIGGRTVARVAGRVAAPFVGKAGSAAAREDVAALEAAAPRVQQGALGPSGVRGIAQRLGVKEQVVRPAQLTESKAIGALQNIAEGGILSGGELRRLATEVEPQVLLDRASSIAARAGKELDPDQLAAAFKAGIEKRIDARNIAIGDLYSQIDEATGIVRKQVPVTRVADTGLVTPNGKPITRVVTDLVERDVSPVNASVKKLKEFAAPLARQAKRLQMIGSESVADREILRIAALEDEIPFTFVAELRSRLLTTRRELETAIAPNRKAIGRIKKLIGLLDDSAESALSDQAPDLLPIFRRANELVTKREVDLNNRLLRGFVRSVDPEKVGVAGGGKPEALLKQVFRSPTTLRATRKALGAESAEYGSLIRGFVSDLLAPEADGRISAKIIQGRIAKRISILNELPLNIRKAVFAFGRAAQRQQSEVTGIGKVGIQLLQFGALGAAIGSAGSAALNLDASGFEDPRVVGGLVTVILAPNIIGRLLTNPVTAKLVVKSMQLSPQSRAAAGAAGQLLGAVQRIADDLEIDLPILNAQGQRIDQPPAPVGPPPTLQGRPVAAGP